MPTPTVRGVSSALGISSVGTPTVNYPASVAAGDMLIIQYIAKTGVVTPTPSGWTNLFGGTLPVPLSGTVYNCSLFWKIAGGSEPSSVTFGNSGSALYAAGAMIALIDAITYENYATRYGNSFQQGTSPSTQADSPGDIILRYYWKIEASGGTITPSSDTEQYEFYDATMQMVMELATQVFAGTGPTGTTAATFSNTTGAASSFALAIRGTPVDVGTVNLKLLPGKVVFDVGEVVLKLTPSAPLEGYNFPVASTETGTIYLDLAPSSPVEHYISGITKTLVRSVNFSTQAGYKYVLPTPVPDTGELYGAIDLSWLYGQAQALGETTISNIQLLDASDGVQESLMVYANNPNQYYWYDKTFRTVLLDTAFDLPAAGSRSVGFHFNNNTIQWTIDGFTSSALTRVITAPIAKVAYGVLSNYNRTGIMIDNPRIGYTAAYELEHSNFEDFTFFGGGEAITVLNTIPTPAKFNFDAPTTNADTIAWLGPLGNTTAARYFEFDISWTAAQEAAWGSQSAELLILLNTSFSEIQYLYHNATGWWDRTHQIVADSLTGAGGNHHIKLIQSANTTTWVIDGTTYGPTARAGAIDSVKFGWSGSNPGGCSITNMKIGSSDGGTEFYDQASDLRYPHKYLTTKTGFSFEPAPHVITDYLDAATARLKYTPSAVETLCQFRTQFEVFDVYNRYKAVSRNHYYAGEVGNRWQAVILVEHAVADPC